jgi:hypothetical protein
LQDFYAAVKAGKCPAMSFIKLPPRQDGHTGHSDPLDEPRNTALSVNGDAEYFDLGI